MEPGGCAGGRKELWMRFLLHCLEADYRQFALRSRVDVTEPPVGRRVVDNDAIPLQCGWQIAFGFTGHDMSFPLSYS